MLKNRPVNAGDVGSIPGSVRSPGEGNGNPLQYSCLGNPTDRGARKVTVHGVAKSWMQLSISTDERKNYEDKNSKKKKKKTKFNSKF